MKPHSVGYLIKEGASSLWKNRTMSIASVGVLLSCLFLMGIAGMLSLNLSAIMKTVEGNNTITVYLEDSVPTLRSIQIRSEFRKIDNITDVKFKPKQDALEEVITVLGENGELLYELTGDNNFLPDAYIIKMQDMSKFNETVKQIEAIEDVAKVTDYSDMAAKISSLDRMVRYASIGIVVILGVVSLFIISNTVKVTMFSRRVEINIMKSVGATNGFVRVPFIVEGIIIGLLAGLISAGLLYFAYFELINLVYSVLPYITMLDLKPVFGYIVALFTVIGVLFGVLGCGISIGKYLKKEGEQAIV